MQYDVAGNQAQLTDPKAGWSGRACLTSVVFKGKIWVIGVL
jgi:hypothetical protein